LLGFDRVDSVFFGEPKHEFQEGRIAHSHGGGGVNECITVVGGLSSVLCCIGGGVVVGGHACGQGVKI
jgi:hypothetical protein